MLVLGVETSCDETGVAVYDSERGLLAHNLYSQVKLHAEYGGVVPELASRDHVRKILPMLEQVLASADVTTADLDGIAYTAGPGLMGALMVGGAAATALGYTLGIPVLGVHHMEGHLLAPMLEDHPPAFPFVALLVSGGHTQLVSVTRNRRTMNCSANRLMMPPVKPLIRPPNSWILDYPGGPRLAAMADRGNIERFSFPRPMTDRPGLEFSFSGLKTFTRNLIENNRGDDVLPDEQCMLDICAGFQEAVVDTLVIKCRRAMQQVGMKRLVIAGGVSANARLREKLEVALAKEGAEVFYARHEFCTDNGAMIAYAGCQRLLAGEKNESGDCGDAAMATG